MNKIVYILTFFNVLSLQISMGQSVTNIDCLQVGNDINISYNLDSKVETQLFYSIDGGSTFNGPLYKVSGNIGTAAKKGRNIVSWHVLDEIESLVGNSIVFKIVALRESSVLVDDIYGIELVYVEGGTFKRGSETGGKLERPVGNVHVSSFYISKCEVHQQLWIDIMGYNTSSHLGKSLPLHGATWYEVHEFIEKLNKKTGKKFRLPTEAEWEFAARGGVRHSDKITKYSSEADIQCNTNSPRNVNEGKCNEIGLFNMAGNVFEWCEDKYGWYEESATIIYNPIGDGELSFTKSIRGGDYSSDYSKCTVTWREGRNPNQPFGVGFRLVHDAE